MLEEIGIADESFNIHYYDINITNSWVTFGIVNGVCVCFIIFAVLFLISLGKAEKEEKAENESIAQYARTGEAVAEEENIAEE